MNFGLAASRFAWVTWPRDTGNRPHELTHAQEKYSALIMRQPSYKWGQVLKGCADASLGTGAAPCTCARLRTACNC